MSASTATPSRTFIEAAAAACGEACDAALRHTHRHTDACEAQNALVTDALLRADRSPEQGAPNADEAALIESQAADLAEVEGADAETLRRNAVGRHGFEARVLARAAEMLGFDADPAGSQVTRDRACALIAQRRTPAPSAREVKTASAVGRLESAAAELRRAAADLDAAGRVGERSLVVEHLADIEEITGYLR